MELFLLTFSIFSFFSICSAARSSNHLWNKARWEGEKRRGVQRRQRCVAHLRSNRRWVKRKPLENLFVNENKCKKCRFDRKREIRKLQCVRWMLNGNDEWKYPHTVRFSRIQFHSNSIKDSEVLCAQMFSWTVLDSMTHRRCLGGCKQIFFA